MNITIVISTFALDPCQLDGIDYPGSDITNFPVANSYECSQRCQNQAGCALFAFSKRRKNCWLKKKKGTATVNADILTGIKDPKGSSNLTVSRNFSKVF